MALPKIKALLICCTAALLCGCGQALSEREIVRAVFFARQQGAYSVCLLLADQNADADAIQYKTSSARGATPAQALHHAEDALPGQIYYGLLDLAALPPDADWAETQTLGTLLYEKAQPAPELSVFVLDDAPARSWAKDAAALYEDMQAIETAYDLHCGLQQLFTQSDCCAVPGYRADSGYDFVLLAKDMPAQRTAGLAAQLAAVLCGQTDKIETSFADGSELCKAKANVTVDASTVQLHLRGTQLQALAGDGKNLQRDLCTELQQDFAALTQNNTADFFHVKFWYANQRGPAAAVPAPQLKILFE